MHSGDHGRSGDMYVMGGDDVALMVIMITMMSRSNEAGWMNGVWETGHAGGGTL